MKVYMAGNGVLPLLLLLKYDKKVCPYFLLQSFYDMRRYPEQKNRNIINSCHEFLLDSGAFSFMSDQNKKTNWKQYIDDYADFVNKYDVKNFIELDLYCLKDVGIKETIKMRRYLEKRTGKKCIPVFHACMGMKMYRELCEEYDYIAIGASGRNDSKWTKDSKVLRNLVKIAESYGTKVHGLGYTRLKNINTNNIGFYSVDSSSWIGSRFNTKYTYKHGVLYITECTKKGERLKDYKQLDMHNLKVWRKVQIDKKER